MFRPNAFVWNNYNFTGHLHDVIPNNEVIHKACLQTEALKTFLAHCERQDFCAVDRRSPESDAIKGLLYESLLTNANLLPESFFQGDGQLIKDADEMTTNILFQLMLIAEYESNIHRLADRYSKHNPKLYGFLFKAIEKFYVGLASSQVDGNQPPRIVIVNSHLNPPTNVDQPLSVPMHFAENLNAAQGSKLIPSRYNFCGKPNANATKEVQESPQQLSSDDEEPSWYTRKELPDSSINSLASDSNSFDVIEASSSYKRSYDAEHAIQPKRIRRRVACTVKGCTRMIFAMPSAVKAHMAMHSNEKPFKCDECDKSFATLPQVKSHKTIHSDDKPFECDECGKRFRTKASLVSHKAVHITVAECMCEQCGKTFKSKHRLKSHMLSHKDKSELSLVKCTFEGCPTIIKDHPSKIRQHMLVHTEREKNFKCEICSRRYLESYGLKNHMRRHTGDMPHKCDVCDKKFLSTAELKNHMTTHTGDRPWKCDKCGDTFTKQSALYTHGRLVHKVKRLRDQFAKPKESMSSIAQVETSHPNENPNSIPHQHFSQAMFE